MRATDFSGRHHCVVVAALASLLGSAAASAEAASEIFVESHITGCCVANPPGPPVAEFFSNSTTASYSGIATQSFSDSRSVDVSENVPIDARQATSGAGPFPAEDDFSALQGITIGMIGARADVVSGSFGPSDGSWESLAEVRATGHAFASATATTVESVTYDVPEGLSLRFFLTETDQFYGDTLPRYQDASTSVQGRYSIVGPAPSDFRFGAWDTITCGASCDSGSVQIAYDELQTGPLVAGRYTFNFEFQTTASVFAVDEPQTAVLMMVGMSLIAAAHRRRSRGPVVSNGGFLRYRDIGPHRS